MNLLLTFLVFFHSVLLAQDPGIAELRQLLFKGSQNEDQADLLYEKVGKYNGSNALLIGYKGAAHALQAKHSFNPISKLKHIKNAQEYFSEAVAAEPENLEIRFLRYSVEVQTPAMLDLSEHVPEDQAILLEELRKYPASNFNAVTAAIARDYLLQYCPCSARDKAFLQALKL